MKNGSFLTFSLHGLLLAVNTEVVREIIWLPELTLIEECPTYIAGVVNMHGKIVPIMDLNNRFGHAHQRYRYSDRIIMIDVSEYGIGNPDRQSKMQNPKTKIELVGIIVNEVLDVLEIPEEDVELPPFEGGVTELHPHFVGGAAKAGEDIIMILSPEAMLDTQFEIRETEIKQSGSGLTGAISYFCPEAEQEEKDIFHKRAIALQHASDSVEISKEIPVAVIGLNNGYFCVDLRSVHEFSKIRNITPVPCCPEHIVGNMNLRGNVLTVVDIRGFLSLQTGMFSESAKVIVAEAGEFPVGVLVEEIIDVVYLKEMDITPLTSPISAVNEKFVKGTAFYGGRMMALLDLQEILSWDGLIVNEET
jgi:purine-binding chemotaxis protein CheW